MRGFLKNKCKNKSNNSGIAMVSVLIIMTVCMLVATVVIEITYTSLLSRKVYLKANDAKYSAEASVDDMESVLQNIAYHAVSVFRESESSDYISILEQELKANANIATGDSLSNNMSSVADFIFDNLSPENKAMFGQVNESGVLVRDSNKFDITNITNTTSLANHNALSISVQFQYKDDKGFVSNISTDLVLNGIISRKEASDYPLGSYSMFNGGGTTVRANSNEIGNGNKKLSLFRQYGNAYIGGMVDKPGVALEIKYAAVDFSGATIINGDVYVTENAALIFSSGLDDDNQKTQVTVKGTIYLDKTSVLNVYDTVDLMCKDIVLVNGNNKESWFEADASQGYGKFNYANFKSTGRDEYVQVKDQYQDKDNTYPYECYFPYPASNPNDIGIGDTELNPLSDFAKSKTTGCVLISNKANNTSHVAVYHENAAVEKNKVELIGYKPNASYVYKEDDETADGLDIAIAKNELCGPTAKTTIWTYDNKAITVDAELCNFVNVPNLYWIKDIVSKNENSVVQANTPKKINNKMGDSPISIFNKTSETTSDPWDSSYHFRFLNNGNKVKDAAVYRDDEKKLLTTSQVLANSTNYNKNVTSPFSIKDLPGVNFSGVSIKAGKMTAVAECFDFNNPNILICACYDGYKAQSNGGYYCGIILTNELSYYEAQGGKKMEGMSVLNSTDKSKLGALMDELKKVYLLQGSYRDGGTVENQATPERKQEYLDNIYRLTMLDSLFVGGMDAFKGGTSVNKDGEDDIKTSGKYDFITIENWKQDRG